MEDCEKLIKESFPLIDETIYNYVEHVLKESSDDFDEPDDIYEAIGEFLAQVCQKDKSKDSYYIRDICGEIYVILGLGGVKQQDKQNGIRKLDAPIQMKSLVDDLSNDLQSIWLDSKDDNVLKTVDHKKLQKAQQKLQQKQEKRLVESSTKVNSTPIISKECVASAAQVISKKESKLESKGLCSGRDVKLENFDIAFGDKVLIQGASLTLAYGRRYGFVGRNGLGKTTLLKMIACGQLKIPVGISVLHVEQEVVGDEVLAIDSVLEADTARARLLAEEKRLTSLNTPEATSQLSDVYHQLELIEADKAPALASVILAGLGFSSEGQKSPTKTFSGGWRMRIALARALFAKPDLLLLDEPTNMLDLKAIIWLECYLQTWVSTLLVVSHDRHFLDEVTTDILHLHTQTIDSYRGNYENFIKTRSERLKNQQREYDAQEQLRAHTQVFIDRFRYNANRAALVQSKVKMLERLPELKPVEKDVEVTLMFPEVEPLNPPVIQADEITFGYVPGKIILNKVVFSANHDSRICVVGENGTGKTTLLKLMLGELETTSGYIHRHRGIRIGYFSQHHVDQLTLNVTPVELLQTRFPGTTVEEYRRQLGRFGISGDLALQSISSLSGGQKSRVAFAAMCYPNPNFMILDEPTNHLDVETIEALSKAITKFKGGVILVSHDERMITNVCKELWICGDQKVNRVEGGFPEYRKAVEKELDFAFYK